ncbi:endonuclease III domain-containing protein [Secundilactobacillus yichangensis]|uniref:endonuclease III domain-containing protein n=1 Tax=Secundilactobacillus yichangensis TaxID=2799580 RepID=UPI0019439ED5|nr:deoxyribonuclease I [Secundilactobacillus yichangensis]
MGPSGWWPADDKRDIIVGAILVQNTAWQNADVGLNNLKHRTGLDPEAVLSLSQTELIELIRASGFYRNKAKAIHNVFQWFNDRHWDYSGVASSTSQAELRKQLLALPGVGQETADVYLVYIFDLPAFIADSYTRRLFKHLGYQRTDTYQHLKSQITLPRNFTFKMAQDFHGQLDEFGKQYLQREDTFDDSFLARALLEKQQTQKGK